MQPTETRIPIGTVREATVGWGGPDELTTTDRLTDIVDVPLLRVDLLVLAGLVRRQYEKELSNLDRLEAQPVRNPKWEESTRWRAAQRRRLFEQLRGAAGPMYDVDYARQMQLKAAAEAKAAAARNGDGDGD